MGVIYAEGDDGNNLLLPFIREKGGDTDFQNIVKSYLAASLGQISSCQFWKSVGLDPSLEDEYLQRHRLSDGVIEFLKAVNSRGTPVWCLSNDVSEWSVKLRLRFGLERYFQGFVISGDVGSRKPDHAIYRCLLDRAGIMPQDAVFIDDRLKNVASAEEMGFDTVIFNPIAEDSCGHPFTIIRTFPELLPFLLAGEKDDRGW
jgi:HAD superfamily hydrolase (TIGR01509 family)